MNAGVPGATEFCNRSISHHITLPYKGSKPGTLITHLILINMYLGRTQLILNVINLDANGLTDIPFGCPTNIRVKKAC